MKMQHNNTHPSDGQVARLARQEWCHRCYVIRPISSKYRALKVNIMKQATLLTRREYHVLTLLAQGRTSKEIASALELSVETVADYRKHLCRKLDLHSTAELVAYAVRLFPNSKSPPM